MKRREFLQLGLAASTGLLVAKSLQPSEALAKDEKIAEKDILRPGQAATIANYCEHPEKEANKKKYCPGWKEGQQCETCQFFNKDNSLTKFKGDEYAHCQLLTDASKPRFVSKKHGWCATYVKGT